MDRFTDVTTTGWGTRIKNSFSFILLGLILFVVSFAVLFLNEGRSDISIIASKAVELDPQLPADSTLQGALIVTRGAITSQESFGDEFLKAGIFVALYRVVEIFSWSQNTSSQSTKNWGGSETVETTYNYVKEWNSSPANSDNFKHPEDHKNPVKKIQDFSKRVDTAMLGMYEVDIKNIILPHLPKIVLNGDNTTLAQGAQLILNEFIYLPSSSENTYENPGVGDVRIRYLALNSGTTVTVFGKLDGKVIVPYQQKKNKLYQMFLEPRAQAIESMHSEYSSLTWLLRLIGFVMMWVGLLLIFNLLPTLLDVVPFFGSITSSVIGVITFIIALVLSIVTIFISIVLHNVYALLIAVALTGFGIYAIIKRRRTING